MHAKLAAMLSVLVPVAIVAAAPAQSTPLLSHLYAVIFAVSVDEDGRVEEIEISKVIDPSTGTTNPVKVDVPDVYVAAVKKQLRQRLYPKEPRSFFTYLFYDPARPDDAAIDPKREPSGR